MLNRTLTVIVLLITAAMARAQDLREDMPRRYAQQVEQPPLEVRVYDLRDMTDALVGVNTSRQSIDAAKARSVAVTVGSLARLVNMQAEPVSDGVFAISGSAASHQQFALTIDALRTLGDDRFLVDFRIVTLTGAQPPSVGSELSPAQGGAVRSRMLAAVERRSPANFSVTTETTYLAGWLPVVSGSAIGYQSQVGQVVSGLETQIGVEDRTERGVRLTVRGSVSDAKVVERKEPLRRVPTAR